MCRWAPSQHRHRQPAPRRHDAPGLSRPATDAIACVPRRKRRCSADLYYNQYRDYDPTTGRYIQADPIGLAGDANPYSYANSNPVGMVDPMGLTKVILFSPIDDWPMYWAARRHPDIIGICRIYGHGTSRTILEDHALDRRDRRLNARQVADLVREMCAPEDAVIELWSCDTGILELRGMASELSRRLPGRTVRAPNTYIWRRGSQFLSTPYFPVPGTSPPRRGQQQGEWHEWQDGRRIP
jgi:RHS repeat-associated protein